MSPSNIWQIGSMPLLSITKDMVEKRHRKISEVAPGSADNVMRVLRAMFTYAGGKYDDEEGRPLIAVNPVKRLSQIKAWNNLPRRQTIIKDDGFKPWCQAVLKLNNETVRDYLLLLLFTGLRANEACRTALARRRPFKQNPTGQRHQKSLRSHASAA